MGYIDALRVINSLPIVDRIRHVQEVLDGIAAESDDSELPDEVKQELARRIAEDDENPQNGIPWEDVKAQLLARVKK